MSEPSDVSESTQGDDRSALLSRRRVVMGGVVGLGVVLAGCSSDDDDGASSTTDAGAPPTTSGAGEGSTTVGETTTTAPICILTPEQMEGPFYLDDELVRADITEGLPGSSMALTLTIVDAEACTPIPDAAVDVWHTDALGRYSGFASGGGGDDTTFMRGSQTTDASGVVAFTTIYPGWYEGRSVHIHVKVHVGGEVVHTGQLYFDDALTDDVHAHAPYDEHEGERTSNAQDAIYRSGGLESTLDVVGSGGALDASITLGVAR